MYFSADDKGLTVYMTGTCSGEWIDVSNVTSVQCPPSLQRRAVYVYLVCAGKQVPSI